MLFVPDGKLSDEIGKMKGKNRNTEKITEK
jgi:hypothetical protein